MTREKRYRQARDAILSVQKVEDAEIQRDANDALAGINVTLKDDVTQWTIGMTEVLKEYGLKISLADATGDQLMVGVIPITEEGVAE